MASSEVERMGGGESGTVPLRAILMKSTKRTLDMFVGQEGAAPPTFMARLEKFYLYWVVASSICVSSAFGWYFCCHHLGAVSLFVPDPTWDSTPSAGALGSTQLSRQLVKIGSVRKTKGPSPDA